MFYVVCACVCGSGIGLHYGGKCPHKMTISKPLSEWKHYLVPVRKTTKNKKVIFFWGGGGGSNIENVKLG